MVVVQDVVIKTPNNKIFYWEMINLTPITTIDIRPPPPTNRLGLEIFGYNDNVWCLGRTSSIRRYDTLKEEIRHNHLHEAHYFFFFYNIPPTNKPLFWYLQIMILNEFVVYWINSLIVPNSIHVMSILNMIFKPIQMENIIGS